MQEARVRPRPTSVLMVFLTNYNPNDNLPQCVDIVDHIKSRHLSR